LGILRERTIYLNNLEKERQQALKFKKLEQDIKKFKASILAYDINQKKKLLQEVTNKINNKIKEIEKEKKGIIELKSQIEGYETKILSINQTIQKSTGLEQERLNQEIANLRAELAGMNVRNENFENKLNSLAKEKEELQISIRETDLSVRELQKGTPSALKNQKEVEIKKNNKLEKLEEQRKKFYTIKSELKSLKERIQDKKSNLDYYVNESEFLLKQIKSISEELFDSKMSQDKLNLLKTAIIEKKGIIETLSKREIVLEKISGTNEYEINKEEKNIEKISKMDICPMCKSKITKEHIEEMHKELREKVDSLKIEIETSDKELKDIYNKKSLLNEEIDELNSQISKGNSDLMKIASISEKQKPDKSTTRKN
jgi:chromosome segregation ATPase